MPDFQQQAGYALGGFGQQGKGLRGHRDRLHGYKTAAVQALRSESRR
jgi:hypothetical protein